VLAGAVACNSMESETEDTSSEKQEAQINDTLPDDSESTFDVNWRNPALTPLGANIVRVIRGYFLVGDYDKMLDFTIFPECYDIEEVKYAIRKSNWGYELKLSNLQWQPDSTFILTIKTTINQTTGSEQYIGKIINDTAKVFLFPDKESLFPYYGDENLSDPCELKRALDDVLFGFDNAVILQKSESALKTIVRYLKNNPSLRAHFIGHTSNEGTAEYNRKLSLQRAQAIVERLVQSGIERKRLSAEGKGMTAPLYPNTTEENMERNRRVEVRLTKM
jgi:outer membrane protein OmpA-like peptidoglycan-associated protein